MNKGKDKEKKKSANSADLGQAKCRHMVEDQGDDYPVHGEEDRTYD